MKNKEAELMSEKVLKEIFRLAQAMGKDLGSFEDYAHDLAVMLDYDDLERAALRVTDTEGNLLVEYGYWFAVEGVRRDSPDHTGGLAVVQVPEDSRAGIIILRTGRAHQYRHLLRIPWDTIPTHTRNGGDEFENSHFKKKTGGRAVNTVYADNQLRKIGRVKFYNATRGYGFIEAQGMPADIFFHTSEAPDDLEKDDEVSFLMVATPKGLQARAVALE